MADDLIALKDAPHGQWVIVVSHGHVVEAKFSSLGGWRNRAGQVIVSKIDGWRPIDRWQRHCQSGDRDVCRASQRDGIVCPADSCDIDDGVRPRDDGARVA